jgi:hypothetical protein
VSVLTWAALFIGLLVAAPLVAHLLRRRPPDEQAFAPARLVPATPAVAHRRTALEDRLLLAVRALAVLGLALLGATPFVRCERLALARPTGASIALAIVIDDSMSMRVPLEEGGPTRFERAHRAAEELLQNLEPGDAVALVVAGRPARVVLASTTSVDAARAMLAKVTQSDRGTDLESAVQIAGELLRELEHVDKRVAVLSDLADGKHDTALSVPEGVKLWIPLDDIRGPHHDCALVRADRTGGRTTARVACSPGVPAPSDKPRRVMLKAGNETLVDAPLRLDGDNADVELDLPEGKRDAYAHVQLTAALEGADAIAADDACPVVSSGGQLRIGIVSDETATRVATGGPPPVEQALKALELGAQLQPLPAVPDRTEELEPIGLLIVDDLPGLTPSQRREVGTWVEEGGVLLITLGPHAAAAPLGSGFAPMLPAIVRWDRKGADGIDIKNDLVFGEASAGLDALEARGRARLDIERDAELRTLAAWKDGAPLLLEHHLGRGVAYSLTLPFSTQESDFALRPGFLALLLRLVETARSLGGTARTPAGTPWQLDGFREVEVARVGTRDELVTLELDEAPGGGKRVTPELAGLYRLVLDGNTAFRVASFDETEVDLRPRPLTDPGDQEAMGGLRAAVDISRYVALVLVALMTLELGLRLRRRAARRRAEAPAT